MIDLTWQTTDGIQIFARCWEPAAEPRAVICLVHGIGEHSGRYLHVGQRLQEAGYGVIAMDHRGHGRSTGKRGHTPSYEALLDDIDRLLAEAADRFPGTPRFLYGQSLGGNLVLNFAMRRRPDLAGVIATSPGLRLAFDPPRWQIVIGRIMRRVWPSFTLARGTDYSAVSRDPAVIAALEADPLVHDMVSARLGLAIMKEGEWAMAHAHDFPLPLLLLHGGSDQLASPAASETFAEKAGDKCTLKIWDDAYHELQNAPEKEEVFDLILTWLEETVSSND